MKKTILVVDVDPIHRATLKLFLSVRNPLYEVEEASSGVEAFYLVKQNPLISFIITDYAMLDGTGGQLYEKLKESGIHIPVLLCTSFSLEDCTEFRTGEPIGYISKPVDVEQLEKIDHMISTHLQFDEIIEQTNVYHAINPEVLLYINDLPCDIYIKISELKYLKILKTGDPFLREDLEKFQNKKINDLFISNISCSILLQKLLAVFSQKASLGASIKNIDTLPSAIKTEIETLSSTVKKYKEGNLDFGKYMQVSVRTQKTLQDFFKSTNADQQFEISMKATTVLTLQTLEKLPLMEDLVNTYKNAPPESFLVVHSTLMAYISCWLASTVGWSSYFTRLKLSMASFVHDMALAKDIMLAKIASEEELALLNHNLAAHTMTEYSKHPILAANIVSKFTDIPSDIDTIILQHHERADGTGFPHRIKHRNIHSLATVFIMAHDYVDYINLTDKPLSIGAFFKKNSENYSFGLFNKIATAAIENEKLKT